MVDDLLKMWGDRASVLSAGIEEATDEIKGARADLHLTNRLVRRIRMLTALLLAAFILILFLVITNRMLFNHVQDCIIESGKCYQRNAANTAKAVQDLKDENQREHDDLILRLQGIKDTQSQDTARNNAIDKRAGTPSQTATTTTASQPQTTAAPAPTTNPTTTSSTSTTTTQLVCVKCLFP